MKITLDSIKIRNFDIWENAHQEQFLNDPNMPFETKVDEDIELEIGLKTQEGVEVDEETISKRVDVEGYYVQCFKKLRSNEGITTEVLLSSLKPERN